MTLFQGDCLEKMKEIPDQSVDAVITDPPYELGFMGKSWDKTGIANNVVVWKECLRVLKPGGHLLSFGGTRTYHRMASAIEDAGFEIRDMIEWVYGSGFPKSLNIGKAVDKLHGNEREKIPNNRHGGGSPDIFPERNNFTTTKGTSEWEGWGTALKPAHEPIVMARKPLSEKTVAENCLKWGTGGIDIDGSRVGTEILPEQKAGQAKIGTFEINNMVTPERAGRFPANLIHDNSEEVRGCFPETKSGWTDKDKQKSNSMFLGEMNYTGTHYADNSGSASRFFKSIIYQAKSSKAERNRGCEELEEKANKFGNQKNGEDMGNGSVNDKFTTQPTKNNHPTVKPIALMEYLINTVTRDGQVVLDPFMGSGTTGVACKNLNRNFIGIELDPDYFKISQERIYNIPWRLI